MAHEINNPKAGIKNAFQILKNESGGNDEELNLIQLIDKEIERIARVLRQMTQLYRPGIAPASKFDLREVIEQPATLLSGESASRGVQIVIQSVLKYRTAHIPEMEFRQIMHNLLLNAIEASQEDSQVTVTIAESGPETISITVRDNGTGIDPSLHSKIFEPFFRRKIRRTEPGSGLGLAISKSLASAIGAGLEHVTDDKPGATFRVSVPRPSHLA